MFTIGACNNEWDDEQFEHYVSFKAPMDLDIGCTKIYIRYNPGGTVTYKLPIIVSGSTTHEDDIDVHVGLDLDTLANINQQHYNLREDLYYRVLRDDQYNFNETTRIPGGEDVVLLDLNFTLGEIDLKDKWVLPLQIKKDPSYNYVANPRKNYSKAILRVIPFNDYSGTYSSTNVNIYIGGLTSDPMTANYRSTYVVDDKTIFFYGGLQDEDLLERGCYKINMRFNDDGTLTMYADDPEINFHVNGTPTYSVSERTDDTLPYMIHRYVTVKIDYYFEDYTSVPGTRISFSAKGSMTMERQINTQIPDEDQAYEW
jgi:hypothetical protein